jgi:hypothetical protein
METQEIADQMARALIARGFGPTVSRWAANSYITHGAEWTAQQLELIFFEVWQDAITDAHNRAVVDLMWASTFPSPKL